MAIYHLSIKIITRGGGKSAVAAAAYRSGESITNEYDGIVHDYTSKTGIVHTEILLPDHAPIEYANRAVLWNAVEKCERYKNAQLAREIEIALPAELTREQNLSLARRFVKETFVNAGMCADVCVHDKEDGNPHAHIMLTMRPIEAGGAWGQKSKTVDGRKVPTVDWNERERAEDWRKAWAAYCNTALRINGHNAVVDHRSYELQGIEQIPTVHMGVAASRMEKRGLRTERGDRNRVVHNTNRELRMLRARIGKLQNWLREESANTKPPTLAEIIKNILTHNNGDTRYQKIERLKAAAKALVFIEENNITDMAGLERKIGSMGNSISMLTAEMKPLERRLNTLDEHIKQAGYYREFQGIYKAYRELKPKHQEHFRNQHSREIILYETADRYLKGVMNGRAGLPVKEWKREREDKTARRDALYREYVKLKEETQRAERMKRSVEELVRSEVPRRVTTRARGMER